MKLTLERNFFGSTFTKGLLSIDGSVFCHTVEDLDRYLEKEGCSAKVQDKTCIPRGTYDVIMDYSNHFDMVMPHILNVPCFDGVRIHSGNSSADTEGCLIVGYSNDNNSQDWIGLSRKCATDLYEKMNDAIKNKESITLEIK